MQTISNFKLAKQNAQILPSLRLIYFSDKKIEGTKYQKSSKSITVIYASCTSCEFEVSGQSLDELDKKYDHHFVISGHDAYFYVEKNMQKIRKVS